MRKTLQGIVRQVQPPIRRTDRELVGLVVLVAVVGTAVALAVRFFEHATEWLLELGYRLLPEGMLRVGLPTWAAFLLYPFLMGFVVMAVKRLVTARDRYHSIPLVIVAMTKRDGVIRPFTTLWKTLSALITLGAGGSLGREGPVVLLGSGIGSAVGQAFRLKPSRVNSLIAAGAGAAIATAFHAPIAGAFFAMEIVLIQFNANIFAMVALASVVAVHISGLVAGAPLFPIPAYHLNNTWEIALYVVLGLVITPLARLYISVLEGSEHLGKKVALPDWVKPSLGGLLFGAVAIALPQTLGGGYGTIADSLHGKLGLGLLLALVVAKLVTIGLTNGSGWPGGVFAPALFLGAVGGGAFGAIAEALFPGVVVQPGAYAVVGMAAMIAGATHAPLTAMALILELTRDYRIALPAMLACGIAAVFSQRYSPYSVDTLHLPEHGILLPWQVQDLRSVRIGDVMVRSVHTAQAGMSLKECIALMQESRHTGYPVLDDQGRLAGMITLRTIREVPLERRLQTQVTEVMTRELLTLTPDDSLADAAMWMARKGIGRIPIVAEDDPTKLLGIVSRSDVLKAYPTEEDEFEPTRARRRA